MTVFFSCKKKISHLSQNKLGLFVTHFVVFICCHNNCFQIHMPAILISHWTFLNPIETPQSALFMTNRQIFCSGSYSNLVNSTFLSYCSVLATPLCYTFRLDWWWSEFCTNVVFLINCTSSKTSFCAHTCLWSPNSGRHGNNAAYTVYVLHNRV